jgi:signal transduction histidine kinase
VSFADLGAGLDNLGSDPSVSEKLRGKIVLVGVTAQASGDRLFTPFSAGTGMPGVEIHANILHTMLTQLFLLPVGEARGAMGLGAVVIATLWALARLHGLWQWVWLAGTAVFVVIAPYARFLEGEVWPGFSLLLSFAVALMLGEAYQVLAARRQYHDSEQKRRQSQQRFEMAAHELRTPLASIQASSELLTRYSLDEPRREQMLKLLHDESQRLGRLVERFLSVERLSAGEMELRREPLELSGWLSALVDRLQPLAARKGVSLSVAPEGAVEIAADAELLEFAVSNLLTNAVKYSPSGTVVRAACARNGNHAEISVADSGPGMAAEEAGRIFERFYRTDSAEQSGNPGFGLGLAIAREIAMHHGGDVRVESRPGFGSVFTLSLPLVP